MSLKKKETLPPGVKKAVGPEVFIFLAVFLLICIWIAEVFISISNRKAGLGGIIKLK